MKEGIEKRLNEQKLPVFFTEKGVCKTKSGYNLYFKANQTPITIQIDENNMKITIDYIKTLEKTEDIKMAKKLIKIIAKEIKRSDEYRLKLIVGYELDAKEKVTDLEIEELVYWCWREWVEPYSNKKTDIIYANILTIHYIIILILFVGYQVTLLMKIGITNQWVLFIWFVVSYVTLNLLLLKPFVSLMFKCIDGIEWVVKKVIERIIRKKLLG